MSLTADPQHTGGGSESGAHSSVAPEALIDLLSDDYARAFLGAIQHEPKSARTIADECGASRATVYRRLNRLRAAGLVTEHMECEADGHHRRTFVATVERVGIELGEDGFEAAVEASDPIAPDRR